MPRSNSYGLYAPLRKSEAKKQVKEPELTELAKALTELASYLRWKKSYLVTQPPTVISVIHYGEIYTRYGIFTTRALSQVRNDMVDSLRYAEPGDVVITDVGETVEDVGTQH
ncbi:hypothetical protein GALL_217290 [mine drainage metagenome]|uniref:Uncharacterized protein n=1 Tax=mine drainage metagenome TaxID=410659 RepID=A0A1J5RLE3_9ZZZZ